MGTNDVPVLVSALKQQKIQPPPIWLMRQAGRYLPEYRAIREQAGDFLTLCFTPEYATEVTLQPIRRFDMDAAILFADILLIPHGLGQPLAYIEGEGPKLQALKADNDLRELSTSRVEEILSPVYETVRQVRTALAPEKALIGFAGSPWTVATYMIEGGGSKDHRLAKHWAKHWAATPDSPFYCLIDLLVTCTIDYLRAQIEAGADAVQLFDSWAGSLSPEGVRQWVIAPNRRIVAALKESHPETPIVGFPRGVGTLYPDFARDTGVDALSIDQHYDMRTAARVVPEDVCLQGNLAPELLVQGGEVMYAGAAAILDALSERSMIFNLGHGIVPETPPDHVAKLVDFVRAYQCKS